MKTRTMVLGLAGAAAAGAAVWHTQRSDAERILPPEDESRLVPLVLPGGGAHERITGGADASAPLPLVLVLHGVGADEQQLVPHTSTQEHARLVYLRGALPTGQGFQWFSERFRGNPQRFIDETRDKAAEVVRVLDHIAAQRPITHTIVLGYSQGAHVAWWLATTGRFDRVIAVSGALPPGTRIPRPPARVRVEGVHGMRDSVVPYAAGQATYRAYADAGYQATWSPARFAGHSLSTIGPSVAPALRRALASLRS